MKEAKIITITRDLRDWSKKEGFIFSVEQITSLAMAIQSGRSSDLFV